MFIERGKGKVWDGLKEVGKDLWPGYWGESTKSFPTMRRLGKFWLGYGVLGGLAALNLVALLAGQPKRPPFEHGEPAAAQIYKSLKWHAAYPGGKLNDWFTSKKAEERMERERYANNEPTRVVWDGKKFYFEIDGDKRDLGEVSKVTPGVWLKPNTPGQSWDTDEYGYYKSAYFGNSKDENDKIVVDTSLLKWLDSRPEVLRFLEEVGMKHKWVQEKVERDPEVAQGMVESGWQKVLTKDDGKVTLERWLLVPYEGDHVLNSKKTAEFIKYLMGKEEAGENITYDWLTSDSEFEAMRESEYLIPRVMGGYMTTFNLTTDEAKWILSDSGTGKQASDLLAELMKGKQIGDIILMLDERETGEAIKKLHNLSFSETIEFTENSMITALKAEGHIGDSRAKPIVDRFGLSYANASWVLENPEILELLYELKAENKEDMDEKRYGIADVNGFIDYLKENKETDMTIIRYTLPGYAANGHLKKVSDREYLGVKQDENWEWLKSHPDIKKVLEGLRTGLEHEGEIYYLSPENLQTDRLLQELMDREYQQNKNSKKEQKITGKYLTDNLESYRKQELILGKFNDYPIKDGKPTGKPIKGVNSNLDWMLHYGIMEPHANDVIYTPEIRAAFDEIYKNKSGDVYKTFKELYKSSDDTRVKAIWSKNYQLVFYEVGYYIANKNKDSGAGIECEAMTGQCKFMEGGAEKNKKKLESVTVAIIKQMKQRNQLNDKVTNAELESIVVEEYSAEGAKSALEDAQAAIDSAKAAGKDTTAAEEKLKEAQDAYDAVDYKLATNGAEDAKAEVIGEETTGKEGTDASQPDASTEDDKPAAKKVKKAKKGGKKKGGKKKASSSGGAGGI